MIAYLDTSALVPLLVAEPTSGVCRRVWADADRIVTSRLTYVEAGAALAMAERQGRVTAAGYGAAWSNLSQIWPDVDVVEVTAEVAANATAFARSRSLRGYDAVHCASAMVLDDPECVAVAGDSKLLAAWHSLGVAVLDVNRAD
ncbi:type II toxin-antitoxin system VapC family toxin [Occultella kanbiaonis]|uniref:type II toxin-antitoxin system VapC family toxin n=1 Tax=Occultella kanbiaonis TaxID=2675754 RepID=UPI0013D31A93|nr:type II toxin-antitoxin system VapC family toxin [Occultella kanbiaonis]